MKLFYRLCMVALVLAVGMTLLSAWIRLSDSGIGCEPWPACFAAQFTIDDQPGVAVSKEDEHRSWRLLHRVMASTFAVVVTVMLVVSLWYRRRLRTGPAIPVVCFLLTALLSIVGINTPDLAHPIVTGINLTGGMLLAALLWHFLLELRRNLPARPNGPAWATLAVTGCMVLAVASGAWVSGNFAAAGCDGFLSCGSLADAGVRDAFAPGRELAMTNGVLELGVQQAVIAWTHQVVAVLAALAVLAAAIGVLVTRGFEAVTAIPVVLTGAVIIQGAVQSPSVLSASLHNLLSLALLLALVYQYHRLRVPRTT